MGGLDTVPAGIDSIFAVVPAMIGLIGVVMLIRLAAPLVDEYSKERQIVKNEARKQVEAAQRSKALLIAEIVLRGEFDEWLDTAVLRLQIDCLANSGDKPLIDVLTVVTQARKDNAARITELHQGTTRQPSAEDADSIRQQWQDLRNRVGSFQLIPA